MSGRAQGSAADGHEQKAALIQEGEVSSQAALFFIAGHW